MMLNKKILYILLILFVSSCDWYDLSEDEDPCDYPDYSDCNTQEPYKAPLKISLTINEENPEPEITIYLGDYEDKKVKETFTTKESYIEKDVVFYEKYSVAAKYIAGTDTIIAIDGTEIEKKSSVNCDSTCWTITGGKIDLRIK